MTLNFSQTNVINIHYTLTDQQFVEDFEQCRLNPSWFNHEAHLRLAYLYIHKLGPGQAAEKICEGILQFDRILGSGDKFHKTITIASIGVLSHFMRKSATTDRSLINEFPQLKFEFKRLLLSQYSTRLLSDISSKNTITNRTSFRTSYSKKSDCITSALI